MHSSSASTSAPRPAARLALRLALPLIAVASLISGCTSAGPSVDGGSSSSPSSVSPSPATGSSPSPGPSGVVSEAVAKYRLIDAVGVPFFCDPDYYPVARADESALASEHLATIQADAATYPAIVARLGIAPGATLTSDQRLAVYRQWKLLRAIALRGLADGWAFEVAIATGSGSSSGERVAGTVGRDGSVRVTSRTAAGILSCPICLARGTRISTPVGSFAVEELRVGEPVWTFDLAGRLVEGRVVALGRTPVPPTHLVVRLVLSDGRRLDASPGHPLLDGRPLGSLAPGAIVDGAVVVSAVAVPYAGGATYDLLASGPTGAYVADGIPLRSTIAP